MPGSRELLAALQSALAANRPCATVTIVAARGSIPNQVGAKMLVGLDAEGDPVLLAGTVGGGDTEHLAMREAASAIACGHPRMVHHTLTEHEARGIGMLCGGQADLFVEVFVPRPRLVLVGGGHVNIAVHRLAKELDYAVTVIDDRPEWANDANFPGATIVNAMPDAALSALGLAEQDFIVIATRDQDTVSLVAACALSCRYVGLVASRRKTARILQNVRARGGDVDSLLPRLRSPIGLDLGPSKSPAEVALSIVAELQLVRHGGSGAPLDFSRRFTRLPVAPDPVS